MTTRILPPEEWVRLAETDIPSILPYTRAEDVQIVVVEDKDRIVGAWAVLRVVHLEGVWIAPEYRKRGTVAARLLAATMKVARQWAGRWAMTAAETDDIRRLIEKHLGGVRVPGDIYVVPMEETCR